MPDADLKGLLGGVITRADRLPNGGLVISISNEGGHFIVQAEACQCGEPCDLTHISVTRISGYGD